MGSKTLLQFTLNYFLRKSLITILICLFPGFYKVVSGQETGDPKEDFLYGEYYVSKGMFREALPFYLSTIKTDSNNCNLNYRIGLCYSNLIGEQEKALPYLIKSVLDINPEYLEGKYKSNGSPVESWLLLGDAYQRENRLTEASYAYYKYQELIGNSDKDKVSMIKNKIDGLGISYEIQRTKEPLKFFNLGKVINSRFSDYNPVLNGNQDILIYTQFWESSDRIMISYKKNNEWSVPVDITNQVGSEGYCYTSSLSNDGNELYLIRYGNFNYDIFVSKLIDGKWTQMKSVGRKVNSKHQESSVCISSDGNTLYFSSDRHGGIGGFDLYSAQRVGDSWKHVKNLGKDINTKKNEEGPYLINDDKVLYFSSNGHETIGNMDIFYSEKDAKGEWQPPQNARSPINTTEDDLFYIYFKNTQEGYILRDLPGGLGKKDIYMVLNENDNNIPIGAFEVTNQIATNQSKRSDFDNPNYNETDSTSNVSPYTVVQSNSDSFAIYTIQVLALKYPLRASKKKISKLNVSAGDDGFHRYTISEFQGWSAALSKLDSIRNNGYPDAFIRNIITIPNYSKPKDVKKQGRK